MEKAYKLLAAADNISNHQAKLLIDRGLVQVGGERVRIARALLPANTNFKIIKQVEPKIIFKDKHCIAIDKPPYITSEELVQDKKMNLVNRLDKETSGVVLLGTFKFRQKAIEEYKAHNVYKEYRAIVNGLLTEERVIDSPILTHKGTKAHSVLSPKGQPAVTYIEPLEYENKKTMLKVLIQTGRTHQIRVHLASIGFPILGDVEYGGRPFKRIMLHSLKLDIFDYHFYAPLPKDFAC